MAGITLEELEINFKANSAQFSKDLNRINRELERQRKQLKRNQQQTKGFGKEFVDFSKSVKDAAGKFGAIAGTITAMFTAVAAGTVALANNVRELENLSRQTGITVKQFRALDFAARQYGMTGEQVADITKDIKDKAQEFARDGTGAFADFATETGLTIEQAKKLAGEMVNLSGDQAIGLMVKRMEDLGLNSSEMVQSLESMGNDLSRLTPLFVNNGAEVNRLTKRYQELTGVLTQEDIDNYKDFAESADLVKKSFISMLENAIAPMLPAITELTNVVAEFFAKLNIKSELGLKTRLSEINTEMKYLQNRKWEYSIHDWEFTSDAEQVRKLKDEAKLLNQQLKIIEKQKAKSVGFAVGETPKISSKGGTTVTGERDTSDPSKEVNKVLLTEEKKLAVRRDFAIREKELAAKLTADKFDDLAAAQERENEAVRLKYEAMRDELEQSGIDEAEIKDRIEAEKIAIEENYREQRNEIKEEMKETQLEELTEFQEAYNSMLESLNESFSNAVAGWIVEGGSFTDAMKGVFKSVLKSFISMLIQQQLQKLIFDKLAAKKKAVEEQGKVAALTSQATAQGTASMAGAPFPINLGAPAFGAAMGAIAGAAQQSAAAAYAGLVGIAHNGISSIPKEGTWLLDGGERVVSPDQNRDLTQFLEGKKQASAGDLQMTVNINASNNVSVDEFFESNIQNFGDQIGIAALDFIQNAV